MEYVLEKLLVIRTIYHNIVCIIYRCVIIITIALRLSTKLLSRARRDPPAPTHVYIYIYI